MTRKEFIERLKQLIQDLDINEQQDVLDYYRDYMDEAGIQEKDSVDGIFESPEKIASALRSSMRDDESANKKEILLSEKPVKKEPPIKNDKEIKKKKKKSPGKILLILVLIFVAVSTMFESCMYRFYRHIGLGDRMHLDDELDERFDYDIDDHVGRGHQQALMVDMDFGKLTIKETDETAAYLEVKNEKDKKHFNMQKDADTIKVSVVDESYGIIAHVPEAVLYIPENQAFDYIELDMDAGSCFIETKIDTNQLYADVDAGAVTIQNMMTDWLEFDCDAGTIIYEGKVNSGGTVDVDAGNVELVIDEKKAEDYNYSIEVSLGEVSLNGEIFSGMNESRYIENHALGTWMLQCDVGKIQLQMNP